MEKIKDPIETLKYCPEYEENFPPVGEDGYCKCNFCRVSYKGIEAYKKHLPRKQNCLRIRRAAGVPILYSLEYPCGSCTRVFTSDKSLRSHVLTCKKKLGARLQINDINRETTPLVDDSDRESISSSESESDSDSGNLPESETETKLVESQIYPSVNISRYASKKIKR